jgi:hypothetical protein
MAEFFDPDDTSINTDPEQNLDQGLDNPANTEPPADPVDEIPEKYKGKTVSEIVKMHQEAEKLIGRQAQEVGEVRKLADELIKQQIDKGKQAQPETSVQEVDFFEDPNKAINQAIENNPILKRLNEEQEAQKQIRAQETLKAKHPDFMEVVANEDFANWVKSSRVRLSLFAQAQNYDIDAADELLSTYKTLKGINAQTPSSNELVEQEKASRKKTLQAASVQTGGSGETSQKVFRRADILKLMMTDRERYLALEPEIRQAYAEGRVKG